MNRLSIFFVIFFFACCNSSKINNSKRDTIEVVNSVYHSSELLEDIPDTINSVSIIKTSPVNSSWPTNAGRLKIFYIADTDFNTKPPQQGDNIATGPIRYAVTKFEIAVDSATVILHGIDHRIDYKFKLIRRNGVWSVSKSNKVFE